ncbi:MAG: type II toxin-antitoxin system HicB family antitoxin [Planctomycetota bacterium]
MRYAAVIEKTDTGFSAYVLDLPGCVAVGSTKRETLSLLRGAVRMHIDGMREDGDEVPEPSDVQFVEA